MVSAAFMLLTVSTLAVHGKHVATVSLPSGCEGMTFCDQKPANYPQKEIDWLLKRDHKNLTFLHRTRRDVGKEPLVLQPGSTDGNCVTEVKMVKPYHLKNDGLAPDIIVQSQFFNQVVPQVTCKSPGSSCFKSFIRDGSGTAAKCKPKKIGVKLYVYNTEDRAIKLKDGEIDIDCVCVVE